MLYNGRYAKSEKVGGWITSRSGWLLELLTKLTNNVFVLMTDMNDTIFRTKIYLFPIWFTFKFLRYLLLYCTATNQSHNIELITVGCYSNMCSVSSAEKNEGSMSPDKY